MPDNDKPYKMKLGYKSASAKIQLGHFYVDPKDIPTVVKMIADYLTQVDPLEADMRVKEDITESLFFLELTVKAKVA